MFLHHDQFLYYVFLRRPYLYWKNHNLDILPILLHLLLVGCTTTIAKNIALVTINYDTVIYSDGINAEEAKIIGQREMIKENLVKFYDILNPKLMTDVTDLPNHEKYWFVSFKEMKIVSSIEFIFIAIINKETGKVKFSDDIKEEKRWILEAALLGG